MATSLARRTFLAFAALLSLASAAAPAVAAETNGLVVYQTDFGLKDGAVATMKGVALSVDPALRLFDLTHDIEPFDIWDAAYQLDYTMPYWPAGTVFVSVIDPGVGTERGAVVARTRNGQLVVSPDNGTFTLVAETLGIDEVRRIDAQQHRLPGSERSFTFQGRDLFSITAAKLASGKIGFAEVGPVLQGDVVRLPYRKPASASGILTGMIPALDRNFGNVWTNIPRSLLEGLGVAKGGKVGVRIVKDGKPMFEGTMPYVDTFGDVPEGAPLLYLNSTDHVAVAISYGSFARAHGIAAGPGWEVEVKKP